MNKVFTWLTLGITTIGLILALLLGMARMQSAPSQGEKLAARANIPHPANVAHRGASYLAPESSRPAYLLARELGADYLEFDLQRTKDGVLVAVHDADLRRVTNVEEVFPGRSQDPVDRFTFAELQQLDAGSWFNLEFPDRARESFQGLKILRLEDVLDIAEDGSPQPGVYIETKLAERYRGIEKQLVQALIGRGWIRPPPTAAPNPVRPIAPPSGPARVILQSFESASLGQLKILAPEVPRLLLL
ncbi:MAG: glycerophosphodiester phosphodiesterase family protein, partial [Nitrospiraceae bacterium]